MRTLHMLPYDQVSSRLGERNADLGEAFWTAVRGNLSTLDEVRIWAAVVKGPIQPVIEDAAFLAEAAGTLPPEPWDETTWKGWTSGLGRKGRALCCDWRLPARRRDRRWQNCCPRSAAPGRRIVFTGERPSKPCHGR